MKKKRESEVQKKTVYLVLLLCFVFGTFDTQKVFATETDKTSESNIAISEGNVIEEQAASNQYQETWQRNIERMRAGKTVTRNIKTTNPEGTETAYTQSVIID